MANVYSCSTTSNANSGNSDLSKIVTGAAQMEAYLPLIKGKVIAIVANQTSVVGSRHLVDTLLKLKVEIKLVFAPEHGFRGEAEAGETVLSGRDSKTGLSMISLYGDHKKPSSEDLAGIDMVVFDIQDVGARFFTYISTLNEVMEACAEKGIPVLVLDRPNPNGNYVDGPILDPNFTSFVGMNPVPVVHGLTMAEYALMLNGEGWLSNHIKCELFYVKIKNWDHNSIYNLPIPPSPNLPNMTAVFLYPSLCFFEGTMVSLGRGTDFPFQVFGYPEMPGGKFTFTPRSIKGKSVKPLYEGQKCSGIDLRNFREQKNINLKQVNLKWLMACYNATTTKATFFNKFFDTLAGSDQLRLQIVAGIDEGTIRQGWQKGLAEFKKKRLNYLLYKDFE